MKYLFLTEFLAICEYLGITPMQFFDTEIENPLLMQRVMQVLAKLSDEDMLMMIGLIDRINR